IADQPAAARFTFTWSVVCPAELYTSTNPPPLIGSPGPPGVGGTIRLASASVRVADRKMIRRSVGSDGVGGSRRGNDLVSMSTRGTIDVVVVVVVTTVVVLLEVVLVVVVPPPGMLAGSAGSLPASISSRSRKPSSSRSMPMRVPEPGGAQVYVRSSP